MAANVPAAQAPAQPAPAPVVFSETPGGASNAIIDYNTKEGKAIWKAATETLSLTDKFDCTPEGLRDFLKLVQLRAWEFGWDQSVLDIPIDPTDPLGDTLPFLGNYGSFSMEHLTEVAGTYVNTPSRARQESAQLYTCLMKSLTREGRSKVTLQEEDYTIESQGGEPRMVGVLLLKVIIRVSAIDTNATVMSIRQQLSSIDTYIATVSYDITKTNEKVNTLLESLSARGETTHDLLSNLFKAYRTVKDAEFVRYMTQKESDYEEGTTSLTPSRLMLLAENKFKTLKEKKEWCIPSAEQEEIVALRADLKKIQQKANKANKSNGKKDGKGKDGKKGDKKGKSNDKKPSKKSTKEWITKAPKPGEPKTKEVDGVTWKFCEKHKKWGQHTTEECEGRGIDTKPGTDDKKTKWNPKLVRAQKATVRFSELPSDDDSSDDE